MYVYSPFVWKNLRWYISTPFPDLAPCLSGFRLDLLDAGRHRVDLSHLKAQQRDRDALQHMCHDHLNKLK